MTNTLQIEAIKTKIYTIRGQKVILDRDLAELYQVETRYLNKAVKRNMARFPEKYMFQLTKDEFENLKFQFGTSSWGGTRKLPHAFTEHGALMAASILNSPVAIKINQIIIDVFIESREQITSNPSYDPLKEKIVRIEAEVQELKASQMVESSLIAGKVQKLSQQMNSFSDVLDNFQNNNIVIKRPEDGLDQDRLN